MAEELFEKIQEKINDAKTKVNAKTEGFESEIGKLRNDLKNGSPLVDEGLKKIEGLFRQVQEEKVQLLGSVEQVVLKLQEKNQDIGRRETEVHNAEQERDNGYKRQSAEQEQKLTQQRLDADAEISGLKVSKLKDVEKDVLEYRKQRMAALDKELDEIRNQCKAECTRKIKECEEACGLKNSKIESERKKLDDQLKELEIRKGKAFAFENELAKREAIISQQEENLNKREQLSQERIRRKIEDLDEELTTLIESKEDTWKTEIGLLKDQNKKLNNTLETQTSLLNRFELLKAQLGDEDPEIVIAKIKEKTDEMTRTLKQLEDMRNSFSQSEEYRKIETERDRWKDRVGELEEKIQGYKEEIDAIDELKREKSKLEFDIDAIKQKNDVLKAISDDKQAECLKYLKENERLNSKYMDPASKSERDKEIEMPLFTIEELKKRDENWVEPKVSAGLKNYLAKKTKTEEERRELKKVIATEEMEWLKGIYDCCKDYGICFKERILKSYHTALKTAEWSPITVLAGVSGTGKSELPKLYSHFGGLNFVSLAVQPNWDSQESMLGFFNSIDNRFDAQPVLKFLAQSQKVPSTEYPMGLGNCMNMVLLDEMNLAHPELYFAEFLSKLELRRGCSKGVVPTIDVKVGSGLEPYKLPLGRNVLWTGTMNQDETTKSLSDKVLDRSIVIYFPRPTTLAVRKELKPLNEQRIPLSKITWGTWCEKASLFDKNGEIKGYREFVEKINEYLGKVGRAIGHRVWQSIEYYMANYPDVRLAKYSGNKEDLAEAMHDAFEDQLVQKIMPKLRGIDTEGYSKTDCLDKIEKLITQGLNDIKGFNLSDDFKQACSLGYGQFMWQSANYLNSAKSSWDTEK